MKHLIALAAIAALLTVSACKKAETTEATTEKAETTTEQAAETAETVAAPVEAAVEAVKAE